MTHISAVPARETVVLSDNGISRRNDELQSEYEVADRINDVIRKLRLTEPTAFDPSTRTFAPVRACILLLSHCQFVGCWIHIFRFKVFRWCWRGVREKNPQWEVRHRPSTYVRAAAKVFCLLSTISALDKRNYYEKHCPACVPHSCCLPTIPIFYHTAPDSPRYRVP